MQVPLDHSAALELASSLDIDIFVFAETLSEPMKHGLGHMRIIKTQVRDHLSPL